METDAIRRTLRRPLQHLRFGGLSGKDTLNLPNGEGCRFWHSDPCSRMITSSPVVRKKSKRIDWTNVFSCSTPNNSEAEVCSMMFDTTFNTTFLSSDSPLHRHNQRRMDWSRTPKSKLERSYKAKYLRAKKALKTLKEQKAMAEDKLAMMEYARKKDAEDMEKLKAELQQAPAPPSSPAPETTTEAPPEHNNRKENFKTAIIEVGTTLKIGIIRPSFFKVDTTSPVKPKQDRMFTAMKKLARSGKRCYACGGLEERPEKEVQSKKSQQPVKGKKGKGQSSKANGNSTNTKGKGKGRKPKKGKGKGKKK